MVWDKFKELLKLISRPFADNNYSQNQKVDAQQQEGHQVSRREHLQAICDYYGIDPRFIIESKLEIYPVYLSQTCWIEYITGYLTVQTEIGGESRYYVRPKCFCPTCFRILHKPENQFVGISTCCGRLYCNFPGCAKAHQVCGVCLDQVCRYCGIILPFQKRLIVVHKSNCLNKVKPYITENSHYPHITNG